MPIPDDERFERYLRQFRPLAADPLPVERRNAATLRFWVYALSAAAVLGLLFALLFTMHARRWPSVSPQVRSPATSAGMEQLANSQPLTLERANDLLAHSPSYKAALDNVAFQRQRAKLPEGSRSALDTLSKEDIKL